MLKRNIAILIAGGLLGAQVTLAAADQSTFPPSADNLYWQPLPAQAKYFADREASNPNPAGAQSPAFARGGTGVSYMQPTLLRYLAQRAASNKIASDAQRTVKVTASTKYVNVGHLETVKIENEKGQSFVWNADTLGEADFPLQRIAPKDFAAGQVRVFVRHPVAHVPG